MKTTSTRNDLSLTPSRRDPRSRQDRDNDGAHMTPMRVLTSLEERAYDQALRSGRSTADPVQLENLQASARASAQEAKPIPYDPVKNQEDAMREREYQRRIAEREELVERQRYASADSRETERRAALVRCGDPRPEPNPYIVWPATGIVTVSLFPTLNDIIPVEDDFLRPALALGFAFMAGTFIIRAILSVGPRGERTATARGGLIGGAVLAAATAIIRLGAARSGGDVLVGIGCTLLELGALVAAEMVARDHAKEVSDWAARKDRSDEASSTHGAVDSEVQRINAQIRQLDEMNAEHQAHVEDRNLRHSRSGELEEMAVRAVTEGYLRGIADNAARLKGATKGLWS